jgi:PAS domain S-box-containing protein
VSSTVVPRTQTPAESRPARSAPRPVDRERPFALDELFFSTTDVRGVITSGNQVFVRVSGYPLEQLLGSPHSIIRHPDMPRVVFALLWERILAGAPIAAYVKNMAADGAYYWVVAMVTPITGGFLSVRLKPSSELLKTVAALYGQLRDSEAGVEAAGEGKKAAIERSRGQLTAALAGLGFADYDAFMQHLLVTEVSSRSHRLGAAADGRPAVARRAAPAAQARASACAGLSADVGALFERLEALLELDRALAQQAAFIRQLAHDLHLLSLNAQIRAAGLGHDGRTLQVVAEQMSGSARATSVSAADICACIDRVNAAVRAAASRIATSHLSVEMMSDFVREIDADVAPVAAGRGPDAAARRDGSGGPATGVAGTRERVQELAEVVATSLEATGQGIREAARQLEELRTRLDALLKEIRTLQILHVTGRMECVRCPQGHEVSRIFGEVLGKTQDARENLSLLLGLVDRARMEPPDGERMRQMLSTLVTA